MKKVSLFLFALALVAVALVNQPVAEAVNCVKPVCSTAGCCSARDCVTWCRSIGGGEAVCFNPGGTGGCCACRPLEG
jgi:hypothetical protein